MVIVVVVDDVIGGSFPKAIMRERSDICSITQNIARYHIQMHTAHRIYHRIGLLFINVWQIYYNSSPFVKERICLMESSHVKHNVIACLQYRIRLMSCFRVEHIGSACLQDSTSFLSRSRVTHNFAD